MVCLFADDTKLTRTFSNIADRADLQESLNEFINWADQWQLQVAEHKCCVLTHGNCMASNYCMKDVHLDTVNHYKDLCVIVDDQCLFKLHLPEGIQVHQCSFPLLSHC